jgi:hypothetical protein
MTCLHFTVTDVNYILFLIERVINFHLGGCRLTRLNVDRVDVNFRIGVGTEWVERMGVFVVHVYILHVAVCNCG